ncbi:MAG: 2-oxoacid ferredoxin oxidoreductase [Parcubacteria group bacterium]|jgi:2-oxoglutarate ferredoxin oxidoreductase subunit beta|nr:2-oxoacid ferredoxin oxidoreductase [Parcubacteria group bacterium]|tara:strand:- start:501 stop:1355 length:855 start_codon:yes stop_codon:yes gene_type:complete
MATAKDFMTSQKSTWCAGCGDFGIWTGLRQALAELNIEPHQASLVFDIGCCGNGANWHNAYSFHGLHGRPIPVAFAIKLANHDLKVIVITGDGGGYGEGTNHFVHSCRANVDITCIVYNNHGYSLTTGQASPTTQQGKETKSTPDGLLETPLNGLQLAITCGATFVSQAYADEVKHLKDVLKSAISHQGFSLVDVLQPCVIYNDKDIREQYKKKIYKLEDTSYKPNDKNKAYLKAGEQTKLPVGILFQEKRLSYEKQLPQISKLPLVKQKIKKVNINNLLNNFK